METPISLPELEQAINYWRVLSPSVGEEARLCPEAAALATPYALMIFTGQREIPPDKLSESARAAYESWRAAHDARP